MGTHVTHTCNSTHTITPTPAHPYQHTHIPSHPHYHTHTSIPTYHHTHTSTPTYHHTHTHTSTLIYHHTHTTTHSSTHPHSLQVLEVHVSGKGGAKGTVAEDGHSQCGDTHRTIVLCVFSGQALLNVPIGGVGGDGVGDVGRSRGHHGSILNQLPAPSGGWGGGCVLHWLCSKR